MKTTTTAEGVNVLKYTATRTKGKITVKVKISLDDDHKNGHEDFSVTGEVYQAGKPFTESNMISCGCVHDDIANVFPEFIPLIKLHLADWKGQPMYAIENGFYHLVNGFTREKVGTPEFAAAFCDNYRITEEQFEALKTSEDKFVFAHCLHLLGIFDQWEQQAKDGIAQLEELTGLKFASKSGVKSARPTQDTITLVQKLIDSGHYSPTNHAKRMEDKVAEVKKKKQDEIKADFQKSCDKARGEMLVKLAVLDSGANLDNFIYYNHTNTGAFNWRGYSTQTMNKDQFEQFLKFIEETAPELPKGIKFELKPLN